MRIKNIILIILIWNFLVCNNEKTPSDEETPLKMQVFLPSSLTWMNSGVTVEMGKRIKIEAGAEALGVPDVFTSDPIPTFAHGALIGRIGTGGRPFRVGRLAYIDGNIQTHGETLFLGRNVAAGEAFSEIGYEPVDMNISVEIVSTDAPGLISPPDMFWSANTQPTFDWDDVDDALFYTVELSIYPDFRLIEQSVTTTVSYVQTAPQITIPLPGQEQQQQQPPTLQPLPEGIHYWRVRAEFNAGRSLSPDLDWSDWSLVFAYGVELGAAPSSPRIIAPPQPVNVLPGRQLLIEFIEAPEPSGVVWRSWLKSADCGQTPQIDTQKDEPSNWRVFSGVYDLYDPNEPPYNYASLLTPALTEGMWLLRIEIRDGSDPTGSNSSFTELNINVGCE